MCSSDLRCSRPGVSLSISFGAAVCDSGQMDFDDLFARADHALYDAKHAGRNRVRLAEPGAAEPESPAPPPVPVPA